MKYIFYFILILYLNTMRCLLLRLHNVVWIRNLGFEVLETKQIIFLRPLVSHLVIIYTAEQLQSRGGESMIQ